MPIKREIIDRHARNAVQTALGDTRVVVLLGARQVGKTTLLEQVAGAETSGRNILTFDDQAAREAARTDPAGFVAGLTTPVALDEVQRVPEVMTEIKLRVDQDKSPGQFLITGSANLLEMKQVKESLAGRAEYLRLFPFSQGELHERVENFVPRLFDGTFPQVSGAPVGRKAYAEMLATGGYPEVQTRSPQRRARWFESYLEGIMEKDLATLAEVAERDNVTRLLRALAASSAKELVYENLANSLQIPTATLRRHATLLKTLFLVTEFPAWSNNLLNRTIKKPKIYVADTGLLAYLVGANAARIDESAELSGMFFETFVAMELQRQIAWQDERPHLFHFRDQKQREVDLILERNDGAVVAIEVKSAASIDAKDFAGLKYLRGRLKKKFVAGAVIYSGANTVPFGDRLAAVPVSGLWT